MSALTAAEWNERYPNGTPALLGSHGAPVYAWLAFVVDNTPMDAWTMVRVRQTGLDGAVLANGAVALESIEPLATDAERLAAEWLDPAGAAKLRHRVGEHDEPCPDREPMTGRGCTKPRGHATHWDGDGYVWYIEEGAWERLTAERDKAIRERDSLARRLALRFEEAERLKADLAVCTGQLRAARRFGDEQQATVVARQSVIEAARAWRHSPRGVGSWLEGRALADAIDAFDAQPTSEGAQP